MFKQKSNNNSQEKNKKAAQTFKDAHKGRPRFGTGFKQTSKTSNGHTMYSFTQMQYQNSHNAFTGYRLQAYDQIQIFSLR